MKMLKFPGNETFTTEEEAEGKLNDNHMDDVFCPLARTICRKDCICYVKSFVYDIKNLGITRYVVQQGYCANEMFVESEGE